MWKLLALLFGCTHDHLSFPFTPRLSRCRPDAAKFTGTYVVCLECGKEFAYDWEQMRVVLNPQDNGECFTESVPLAKRVA